LPICAVSDSFVEAPPGFIIVAYNARPFYSSSVALLLLRGGSSKINLLEEEYSSNLESLSRDEADKSSVGDGLRGLKSLKESRLETSSVTLLILSLALLQARYAFLFSTNWLG
jgi:hypothetical protein